MKPIALGYDYSAGRISSGEIRLAGGTFVVRYTNWPGQQRSYLTIEEQADLRAGGVTPLLVHEHNEYDVVGGYDRGQAYAREALAWADQIGYPSSLPIFFCSDMWLPSGLISSGTALAYIQGAASILGYNRTGAYGFRDFIRLVSDWDVCRYRWLCGERPTDDEISSLGLCLYQVNDKGPFVIAGVEVDCDEQYLPIGENVFTPDQEATLLAGAAAVQFGQEGVRQAGELALAVADLGAKLSAGLADISGKLDALAAKAAAPVDPATLAAQVHGAVAAELSSPLGVSGTVTLRGTEAA